MRKKYWHKLFELGILIKGINGALEIISGFLFLFANKETLNSLFYLVARNELLEDPNDILMNFIGQILQNLSIGAQSFAAIYILLHGILNVFLVIQIYRGRYWAYLAAIGAVSLFIPYQIYRISVHHSLLLTAFTIFDIFFIVLAWHEYRYYNKTKIRN